MFYVIVTYFGNIYIIAECLSMRHIIVRGPAAGSLLSRSAYIYIFVYIYVHVYGKMQKYTIAWEHSLRHAPLLN